MIQKEKILIERYCCQDQQCVIDIGNYLGWSVEWNATAEHYVQEQVGVCANAITADGTLDACIIDLTVGEDRPADMTWAQRFQDTERCVKY